MIDINCRGLRPDTLAESRRLRAPSRIRQDRLYRAGVPGSCPPCRWCCLFPFVRRVRLEITPVSPRGRLAAPMADIVASHVPVYFATFPVGGRGAERHRDAVHLLAVRSEQRMPRPARCSHLHRMQLSRLRGADLDGLMASPPTPRRASVGVRERAFARGVQEPGRSRPAVPNLRRPARKQPEASVAMLAADIALWGEAIKPPGRKPKQPTEICQGAARADLTPGPWQDRATPDML